MPDRPDAPRLEEALAELAGRAETDTAKKIETAALLALGEADELVPTLAPSALTPPSSRTRTGVIAALAIAILAVGAWTIIDLNRSMLQSDTGPAAGTPRDDDPEPGIQAPPPLTQADLCQSTGTDAEGARLLDTAVGPVEVGVRAHRGTPVDTRTVLVIGPGSDWRTIADRASLHDDLRATAIVYAATASFATTSIGDLVDHLATNLCEQGPIYLVSIDNAMGADVACFSGATTSFSGFVFVGHELPPSTCSIRRPTLVIDDELLPRQRERWAQHMSCADPATRLDSAANEITAWATCRNTLVHLVTPSDPWTAMIDDVPARDFIFATISVAN
ncbi:MAG: hypothetical protein AAF547_02515 [Actinomycetota bacterium]